MPQSGSRLMPGQLPLSENMPGEVHDSLGARRCISSSWPTIRLNRWGPFNDTLALLTLSAPLERFGVRTASISGYPEGHPHISHPALWAALIEKANTLVRQDKAGDMVAQFGFDADAVISWIEAVRDRGIDLPIRVGTPGPARVKRLLSYAIPTGG